jgi:hypothetical protein
MKVAGKPKPDRQRLTTITIERLRCPTCRGVKLRKYRSVADQGDGSALCWVRCSCGNRFRVVSE